MQWLNDLPFGDNRVVQIGFLAACGIAVLVALAIVYRLVFAHRLRVPGGRTRQARLGLVDAFSLDGQRQLVLVRRDNVEHLVMIGGPNDVLLESQISRASGAVRDNVVTPAAMPRRRADAQISATPPAASAQTGVAPVAVAPAEPLPIAPVPLRPNAAPPVAAQPSPPAPVAATPSPAAPAMAAPPVAAEAKPVEPAASPLPDGDKAPATVGNDATHAPAGPARRMMPQPITPLVRAKVERGSEAPAQRAQAGSPAAAPSQAKQTTAAPSDAPAPPVEPAPRPQVHPEPALVTDLPPRPAETHSIAQRSISGFAPASAKASVAELRGIPYPKDGTTHADKAPPSNAAPSPAAQPAVHFGPAIHPIPAPKADPAPHVVAAIKPEAPAPQAGADHAPEERSVSPEAADALALAAKRSRDPFAALDSLEAEMAKLLGREKAG